MNILEKIIAHKKSEVEAKKKRMVIQDFEKSPFFSQPCLSFPAFLNDPLKTGIIAEFKRRSPSKGVINERSSVTGVIKAYADHKAAAVSILTDEEFFGGSLEDLIAATDLPIPVLRKDFIVDEFQLFESKAAGADIILLIAACLSPNEVRQLAGRAKSLGLNVLLEIHNEEELAHVCDFIDVVGVNNRNLKTFQVNLETSIALADNIPASKLKISESGIYTAMDIITLRSAGFNGFLIGERFMIQEDPGQAFGDFVVELTKAAVDEN